MMMKSFTKPGLLLLLSVFFFNLNAQEEESELSLDAGSIDSQFEYVIEESNEYQQYEVIPGGWMTKLRSHVNDTLQTLRSDISELETQLEQRDENITTLETDLAETRGTLEESRLAQAEMRWIGIPMEKELYRIIMWSIIGVLLLLLLIFIYRFNRSNAVTRQSRSALAEVQLELEQHRKRSLEREQKLRRQLQDELNKQRNQNNN